MVPYVYSLKMSWKGTCTQCPKYVCSDTAFESSVKSLISLKIQKYIPFLLQQLYSLSALLPSVPEAQRSRIQILPKLAGQHVSLYTGQLSVWVSLRSLQKIFSCCSQQTVSQGKKQHGFVIALLGWSRITTHYGCGGLRRVLAQVCCSSRTTSHSQARRRW